MRKFRVFAHRGLWMKRQEENSLVAISRALESGCDIEADLRITNGKFVINHDRASPREQLPTLRDLLSTLERYPERELALHFKYDDWRNPKSLSIIDLLQPIKRQVFLFDMSLEFCEQLKRYDDSLRVGVSVGDRHYHPAFAHLENALSANIDIIWADEFRRFYDSQLFESCHSANKLIYCISPDLAASVGHPRAHTGYEEVWRNLIEWGADGICTDRSLEVKRAYADSCARRR